MGKVLVEGCALAAPCRNQVAEKVLEYGVKAGITAVVAKEIADNLSSDELGHLITLSMMGNDILTNKFLGYLQDKYVPSIALDPNDIPKLEGYPIPDNNIMPPFITPIPEQDKDDGKFVTPIPEVDKDDGKFVTPIPERDKNDGILLGPEINVGDWRDGVLIAEKPYEPNKGSVGNMGEFLGKPGFGTDVKDNSTKTKQQYGGQSIHVATDNIGNEIKRGDKFYLDGLHKDHIEVFDSRGRFKFVLNLDGTKNDVKTKAGEGRRLPK